VTLLEITASNRARGSLSRDLSDYFIEHWMAANVPTSRLRRDVGTEPPAAPTGFASAANYTPPDQRTPEMIAALAPSETLIAEFLSAERLVIATPMYNFSIPAPLKAYLDNIVRVGRTFSFDPATFTFTGLATGKRALLIVTSAGDYAPNTPMAAMDFCGPYLKAILGFMGVTDVTTVSAPNQFAPPEVREQVAAAARQKLLTLASSW
jgi:FMN-dependent NADH-azoreductase